MQQILRKRSSFRSSWLSQDNNPSQDMNMNDKIPKPLTKTIRNSTVNKQKKSKISYLIDGIKGIFKNQICDICLNPITNQPHSIAACNHKYCQQCLGHYIKYKIDAMQQIVCPNQQCSLKLDLNCEIYKSMPQSDKQKYQKQQIWRQNMNNSDYRMCWNQKCNGLINLTKIPPQCQKCHIQICKQCMMKYHEGPCDQNFQANFKQWKRCPNCKVFIQKQIGCNHMVCRCKYEFCYVCLSPFDPTHYQCIQKVDRLLIRTQSTGCPKILAFFLIIIFPIVLSIGLAIMVILLAISTIFGIFSGIALFCEIIKNNECLCCCTPILCPCLIVFGIIAVPIVLTLVFFIPFSLNLIERYWQTIFQLC